MIHPTIKNESRPTQPALVDASVLRAAMRDAVAPLAVTLMSAGSHTEPGGYTGLGRDGPNYPKWTVV